MEHRFGAKPIIFGTLGIILASAIFVIVFSLMGHNSKIVIGNGTFEARIISDEVQRSKILIGGFQVSGEDKVLLAFPSDGIYSISMKNITKPIDILWLNSSKKIIHIQTTTDLETGRDISYKSLRPARYIIELPAGTVKKSDIKVNQVAQFAVKTEDIK